jgi:hypothetical protein
MTWGCYRAREALSETLMRGPATVRSGAMPFVGVRVAAVLLTTVGDGTSFPAAAHLAVLVT